ncbi:MAG: hypothetical protein HQK51_15470 [Oligoflexia bacterium]|nr:hypothetical protein [Oligoflexia bacterium]
MYKKYFTLYLLLCFLPLILGSVSSYEQNILQAKLTVEEVFGYNVKDVLQIKELKIGDTFNGIIEVWPKNLLEFPESKDFEGKVILGLFYVSEIKSIKTSENNDEVIVIDANMVLIKSFADFNFHILKFRDKEISTFIENNIKINNDSQDKNNVIFSDFKYADLIRVHEAEDAYSKWIILITIISGILLGMIYLIKTFISSYKKNAIYRSMVLYWKELFEKEILKREDFELIYKNKTQWIPLIKNYLIHQKDIEEFLLKLDLHQYRRNWDQHVYNEVTGTFKRIRYIWSDNFNKVHN